MDCYCDRFVSQPHGWTVGYCPEEPTPAPEPVIIDAEYRPHVAPGCRVTVIFRATCPSCQLPFPLRTDMQQARQDAAEHDRLRHGPFKGSVQGPPPPSETASRFR